jgi:hypothetical protein
MGYKVFMGYFIDCYIILYYPTIMVLLLFVIYMVQWNFPVLIVDP